MKKLGLFILLILILNDINISAHEINEDEITQIIEDKVITYGSILRIQNVMTKYK
jgi:hypothetical protein